MEEAESRLSSLERADTPAHRIVGRSHRVQAFVHLQLGYPRARKARPRVHSELRPSKAAQGRDTAFWLSKLEQTKTRTSETLTKLHSRRYYAAPGRSLCRGQCCRTGRARSPLGLLPRVEEHLVELRDSTTKVSRGNGKRTSEMRDERTHIERRVGHDGPGVQARRLVGRLDTLPAAHTQQESASSMRKPVRTKEDAGRTRSPSLARRRSPN